jgi:hypothetical protein
MSVEETFASAGFVAGRYGAIFDLLAEMTCYEMVNDHRLNDDNQASTYVTFDIQSHTEFRSVSQSLDGRIDVASIP